MSTSEEPNKSQIAADAERVCVAFSVREVVARGGDASAELIKGYSGIDNQTGQVFNRSLRGIADGKVNPEYAQQNIRQQAGFSAEVLATAKDNANAILVGSPVRSARSEDLPQYGKNHAVIDRVKLLNGKVIAGTETQTKFVGKPNNVIDKIVSGKGENDLSRYQDVGLELPSEQVMGVKQHCTDQAAALRQQANAVEQNGNEKLAQEMRKNADTYDRVRGNCLDSGVTSDEAVFARTNPKITTALLIIKTSHQAAVESAKYGAVVGGTVSLVKNFFYLAQDKKTLTTATSDVLIDTTKSTAVAYASTHAGSTIKGLMQQSSNATVRGLSKTSLPTLALSICLSARVSITRYVKGEIDAEVLAEELGEMGTGMLCSSMMAAIGQVALPVPFVGAAVGSMIGYTLSSLFYTISLDASRQAKASQKNSAEVQAICTAARAEMLAEQHKLNNFLNTEFAQLSKETQELFISMEANNQNTDAFAMAINRYANLLGAELEFKSEVEFENFMHTAQPLVL